MPNSTGYYLCNDDCVVYSLCLSRPPSLPPKPKNSRRLGKIPKEGAPKLFGGSIEEYVEVGTPMFYSIFSL